MKVRTAVFGIPAVLAAGLALHELCRASSSLPPPIESEHRVDYLDDQDGRINGEVRVQLTADAVGRGSVQLTIGATGPYVESQPGFQGMRGGNLHTAFQLAQMARHGFQVATFDDAGRYVTGATRLDTRWKRLFRRELLANGTIAYQKPLPIPSLVELRIDGRELEPGTYRTEIWAHGEPRMRIRYRLAPHLAALLSVEMMGHSQPREGPDRPPAVVLMAAVQAPAVTPRPAAKDTPSRPPTTAAEWNSRDIEGKWALYRQSLDADPGRQEAWIDFLFQQSDHEFLETIALHQLDAFETLHIGRRLKEAHAPNWIRVTVWCQRGRRGHLNMTTIGLLTDEKSQDEVYSWFQKYPEMRTVPGVGNAWDVLVKASPNTVDVSHLWPPLKEEEVLADLDVPPMVQRFGERRRAEPGVFYLQQAERAIMGMIVAEVFTSERLGQLSGLADHPDTQVRLSAILAHTHLKPEQFDGSRFLRMAHDEAEPASVREAALMAFSYSHDYEVYAVLHNIAANPGNAVWKTAISRLGDIGDGFTLHHLRDLQLADPERRKFLEWETERIRSREREMDMNRLSRGLGTMLQRSAWARLHDNPIAVPLAQWIRETVRGHAESEPVRKMLTRLSDASKNPGIPEPFRAEVAEEAGALLRR